MTGKRRGARGSLCSILMVAFLAACSEPPEPAAKNDADVLIVGAGLAGLSAAIDAASGGARVLVIDMNSVFGGHGIQSGGVAIIGSPMQEAMGFRDTPEAAYEDWMAWTEDGHPGWTRFYVEHSRELIYDWVTGLGVRFDRVIPSHGNSVPRFHMTYRRGLNLVRPLYLEALRYSNIEFRWNLNAEHLIKRGGRVVGVAARAWRLGEAVELYAGAVILATGGFQSNQAMVKENWPPDLPVPAHVYGRSGQYSRGSGHRMAREAGAALVHMDRQYNYLGGMANVFGDDPDRGTFGANSHGIWVNAQGRRFVTEGGFDKQVFPVAMAQEGQSYWLVFDAGGKAHYRVGGPEWVSAEGPDRDKIERLILGNPEITKTADSVGELARAMGVPADALTATVARYNARVKAGEGTEVDGMPWERPGPVFTIEKPPFHAVQLFPAAVKSAGGIAIDMSARALDEAGAPVPGLYAAGEVTGSAGINGLHGLDGTFTGPAILIGRVAGRTAAADLAADGDWSPADFVRAGDTLPGGAAPEAGPWTPELDAEALASMLGQWRDGYWHFEMSHRLVVERNYACTECHSARVPFYQTSGRANKLAQAETCDACHLAPARR